MRSPQHSIPASSCAAQHNASTRSTCSTPDPSVRDTSAHLASVPIHCPLEGAPGHSLRRGRRRGGVVVLCQMRMPCRLLCWVLRGILRFCDPLCGMGRSYRLTMTCGSHCVSCASPPLPLSMIPLFVCRLAVLTLSSSRRRWGLSYPHQTAMCVYSSPSLHG
jgi:hypothetical protein